MTQHNAALVEETAAASEEMSNQAQELMSLMSLFKIREKLNTAVKTRPGNGKAVTHETISVPVALKKPEAVNMESEGYEKF